MSWENILLSKLCLNFGGGIKTGPFGAQLHEYDYCKIGIPVVMPKDIKCGKISDEKIARISSSTAQRLQIYKLSEGDIIYPRRGDISKCAYITKNENSWICGTGCLRISIHNPLVNTKFLYYYLLQSFVGAWLEKHAIGATMLNLNTQIIGNLPIKLLPYSEQNKIADILSSYDDLIENNQKQIKLLEEAAQRLYKEWFVDFRFPGYETTEFIDGLPISWGKFLLGDLIEYNIGGSWGNDNVTAKYDKPSFVIRGTDLYNTTHGNAKNIPYRYLSEQDLTSRQLKHGDIVFEVSGGSKTEGVARTVLIQQAMLDYWSKPVICASFCKLIRLKNISLSQYMYDSLRYLRNSGETTKYDKRSASSIVNYRWKDFLQQTIIVVPNENILKRFNNYAKNIYAMIISRSQSIENIRQIRDALLPKLMNGELEVNVKTKPFKKITRFPVSYKENTEFMNLPFAARKEGEMSEDTLQKIYTSLIEDDD